MSPKWIPIEHSLQFQGWSRTSSSQVCHGFLPKHDIFKNKNGLGMFPTNSYILDEMERYQAHKEFGDRRIGVYGARTFFYQASVLSLLFTANEE